MGVVITAFIVNNACSCRIHPAPIATIIASLVGASDRTCGTLPDGTPDHAISVIAPVTRDVTAWCALRTLYLEKEVGEDADGHAGQSTAHDAFGPARRHRCINTKEHTGSAVLVTTGVLALVQGVEKVRITRSSSSAPKPAFRPYEPAPPLRGLETSVITTAIIGSVVEVVLDKEVAKAATDGGLAVIAMGRSKSGARGTFIPTRAPLTPSYGSIIVIDVGPEAHVCDVAGVDEPDGSKVPALADA